MTTLKQLAGLDRTPGPSLVGVHQAQLVQGWLDHAPGVLHTVLAGEATVVTVQGVVQEALTGFLSLTERIVEVDIEIDRLGRELLLGAFRLGRASDPVLVSESERTPGCAPQWGTSTVAWPGRTRTVWTRAPPACWPATGTFPLARSHRPPGSVAGTTGRRRAGRCSSPWRRWLSERGRGTVRHPSRRARHR